MGYSAEMFTDIAKLNLQNDKVLDIGAQDVSVNTESELLEINAFISRKNPNNVIALSDYPNVFEAKEIYKRAGYHYTSIDVDDRPETLRVDLAAFRIPKKRGIYPLVVNVGTTEHLSSPVATFALMHELCANSGFMYHDVPLFGFGNHGLINPTPKFWHALIWMNQYSIVCTNVRRYDEAGCDSGNFYHDYLDYFQGLSEIQNITFTIRSVLQKQNNNIFVCPFDAVFPNSDNGKSLAMLLAGSYYPFICTGAYTAKEVVKSINGFLKLNQRKYRADNYYELLGFSDQSDKYKSAVGLSVLKEKLRPLFRL